MTIDKAKALKKGDQVFFAGKFYDVAVVEDFPHGVMIGIYEDPLLKDIDFLNPNAVDEVYPCGSCQGGGCPVCGGYGLIIC